MAGFAPVLWILNFVGFCWLSAGVTYAVVSDLRGQRASTSEIFGRSLASVPRLLLLFLIIGIISLGVALLMLIPFLGFFLAVGISVWLYVIYWVALPAVVVEKSGPIISMGRSKTLAKGHRWQVMGVLAVWIVVLFVVGVLTEVVLVSLPSSLGSAILAGAASLIDTVVLAMGASLAAVGYHDLRVVKEGVGSEEIARVFD